MTLNFKFDSIEERKGVKMCLSKLFCRHKRMTAIGIYEVYTPHYTSTRPSINVVCKCNKCGKELEFGKLYMQQLRREFRIEVDVSPITSNLLWGKW